MIDEDKLIQCITNIDISDDANANIESSEASTYIVEAMREICETSTGLELFKKLIDNDKFLFFCKKLLILNSAIMIDNRELVRFILEEDMCKDLIGKFNDAIALTCVLNDKTEMLKILCNSPKIELTEFLCKACMFAKPHIVKILLEHDRNDVNKKDRMMNSPINYLPCSISHPSYKESLEIFKMLIDYPKFDVNQLSCYDNNTILHTICQWDSDSYDPLLYALESGRCNHLINKRNNKYQTPLYIACMHTNIKFVKLLLEQPEIDLTEDETYFGYDYYSYLGVVCSYPCYPCVEILSMLLEHPKIQILNSVDLFTPIALCYNINIDDRITTMLKILLEDPRIDPSKSFVLFSAADYPVEILQLLLNDGRFDINLIRNDMTAVHRLLQSYSRNNIYEKIKMFFANDRFDRNYIWNGKTYSQYAENLDHSEDIIQLIKEF